MSKQVKKRVYIRCATCGDEVLQRSDGSTRVCPECDTATIGKEMYISEARRNDHQDRVRQLRIEKGLDPDGPSLFD